MASSNENAAAVNSSFLTEEEKQEFKGYEFPFENLALEGGGSKGKAYVGVVRVLEELGVMKNVKRFAGASIGAIVSAYLAVGYNSRELEKIIGETDFTPIFNDARGGMIGQFLNFFRLMGLHPGNKLASWITDNICEKTKDTNITFRQLYKQRGVELCVIVTNLNLMDVVYHHVKTSPDVPIAVATKASSSVPGWFLSMDADDSFFNRFSDLANIAYKWDVRERFDKVNKKTIGVILYSEDEQDLMKTALDKRITKYQKGEIAIPDTMRSRHRAHQSKKDNESKLKMMKALGNLMTMLKNSDLDKSGTISRDDFKTVLLGPEHFMSSDDIGIIFGSDVSPDAIFDIIDSDKSGQIEFQEIVQLASQRGVDLLEAVRGYDRREITGIKQLLNCLRETLVLNVQRVTTRTSDYERTIGINTRYLQTLDMDMEKGDQEFLMQCGKEAALCFLREYIETNQLCRKSDVTDPDEEGN